MRLGVRDTGRTLECGHALADGGVGQLVVHARTKLDGYRPPAHWPWVGRLASSLPIPVVANGEVWCEADWRRCLAESGVQDVMLGRGAVADPFLARRIRSGESFHAGRDWPELATLIGEFWLRVQRKVAARHAPGRLKQWLNLLRRCYPQAEALFSAVRQVPDVARIGAVLAAADVRPLLSARNAA